MDAADARPEDVAGVKRVALVVGDDLDVSFEHDVRLLERMVVGMGDGSRLVGDHEHRLQLGIEALVDEHLHGDAAVGECRGCHARGDRRLVDGRALLQPVDVHVARAEQEQVAVTRVADIERQRVGVGGRPEEEGVRRPARPAGTRRQHLDPAGRRPRCARHAARRPGIAPQAPGFSRTAVSVEKEDGSPSKT